MSGRRSSSRSASDALRGIPRATFYRWCDRYLTGGPEALEDRPAQPGRVWNRIHDDLRRAIIETALEQSELSPRAGGAPYPTLAPSNNRRVAGPRP